MKTLVSKENGYLEIENQANTSKDLCKKIVVEVKNDE